MRKHISDGLQVLAAILITGSVVAAAAPVPPTTDSKKDVVVQQTKPVTTTTPKEEPVKVAVVEKPVTWQDNPNKCNEGTQWISENPPFNCIDKPAPTVSAAPAVVASASDNETIIWNYLIAQGFSREQTAGIMGNLQQEHNFNTSDVPGGLGIAQWIGGRRANLMAKGDYLNINTQLNFLMEELKGSESVAHMAIRQSYTVEDSTIAFSKLFERCGVCRNEQRINYAYAILGRH